MLLAIFVFSCTEHIPQGKCRNHWAIELCPSFGILKTEEHCVSETGSVSVLL
jgi:hypothetical protein